MMLLNRYKELGEEFNPKEVELQSCLRVNTLKISCEELISRLKERGVQLEKVPYLDNGYFFTSPFTLSSCEEYLLGYFYIQEGASQLPVQALLSNNSLEQPLLLDMCAAPGSKTTQLAQDLNQKGIIFALDNHIQRLKILHHNLERLGVKNVVALRKEGQFADDLKQKFDYILLDAPCSGNFCIEPNYFIDRNLEDNKQRATVQKDLLKAAYKILKEEGTLVYSTCSLEPEEDELVIDWFIKKYPNMQVVSTDLTIGDKGFAQVFGQSLDSSLENTTRIWPHKTGLQGFFIAKLVKKTL